MEALAAYNRLVSKGKGDAHVRGARAVLYLGVVATALTTWLQTWGQRHVPAPQAAILYTLEPVWAAFFAYLALGERLSPSGLLGALLVLLATLLAIRRSPA